MKSLYTLIFFVFLAFACDNKTRKIDTSANITPEVKKEVTIYGSLTCDHCVDFRKLVDSVGIAYTFKDVELNSENFNELSMKIQQARYDGYVSYPVVDIDDKIYVRPEFVDFMRVMKQ